MNPSSGPWLAVMCKLLKYTYEYIQDIGNTINAIIWLLFVLVMQE